METMKVEAKKKPEMGDGIPVYEIRFCNPGGRDIGIDGSGGTGILRVRDGREITYYPQRRWFKITERRLERPIYVHETWVSWQPLEA